MKHVVLVTYGEPTSPSFIDQLVYSWRILLGLTRSVADIPAPLIPLIALSRARGRHAMWRQHEYGSPLEPITLERGRGLRGRVLDPTGLPMAGATVRAGNGPSMDPPRAGLFGSLEARSRTDSEGRFELASLASTGALLIASRAGDAREMLAARRQQRVKRRRPAREHGVTRIERATQAA